MKIQWYSHPAIVSVCLLLGASSFATNAWAAGQPENLLPAASGWENWSPRANLTPEASIDQPNGAFQLRMRAKDAASYGEWHATARNIQGGSTYHFEVRYQPTHIDYESVSVPVIAIWRSAAGKALQYDYVSDVSPAADGWRVASRTLAAPAGATTVTLKLVLRWTATGSVVWNDPQLTSVDPKPHRKIRVVTTCIQPGPSPTVQKNIDLMAATFDRAGELKPDLVLFTEVFVDREVPLPITQTAQPIPGPATEMLSERARRYHTWVATSIHELDHGMIYNTGVLIDREGRIAGKYRKIHLVVPEAEEGITPGSDYPVFTTDFGRVGMLICWDNWFQEDARILRMKGAEMILFPTAGDGAGLPIHWDVISRARAIDNSVFFIASCAHPHSASVIIDPNGHILASTSGGIASMDIDLDQATQLHGFGPENSTGEPRTVYVQERRPDTYHALSEPEPSSSARQ